MKCGKHCFSSESNAKRTLRKTRFRFRIRTYYCRDCGAWHVANNEKRKAVFIGSEYRGKFEET